MKSLMTIFSMHGYGAYVYSAYAIVLSTLGMHLFWAFKRSKYIKSVIASMR